MSLSLVPTPIRTLPDKTTSSPGATRADALVRGGGYAAAGAGLVLVTYWWAADGGLAGVMAGWVPTLISTGRLTGLLAALLLLLQVLLMARIPLLEQAFGHPRLITLHHWAGLTAIVLTLAHIRLISWGYVGGSFAGVYSELWYLLTRTAGLAASGVGTVALLVVTVTSLGWVRRRLLYESWRLLHLWAYAAVFLALPHQLHVGRDFITSWSRTVFWWGLWAACAATVLVWRVAMPIWRSIYGRLRVDGVVPETDGTVSVYMTGRVQAQAGQFFIFRFLDGTGTFSGHPYSLSAAPTGHSLRITVRAVGDGSAALAELRPGCRVLVEGPYGRLTERIRTRRKLAFFGSGVGITPLRALAEGLDYDPDEAVLLYRFTRRPVFEQELQDLSVERGLQVIWLPGPRRWDGSWLSTTSGHGDDVVTLLHLVPDIAERDVFACGPTAWAETVRAACLGAGLREEAFHVESWSG